MMIQTQTTKQQKLKEAIRGHYNSVSLSSSQVKDLEQMYANIAEETDNQERPPQLGTTHNLEAHLQELQQIQSTLDSKGSSSPEEKIIAIQDGLRKKSLPTSSFSYVFSGVSELSSKNKILKNFVLIALFSLFASLIGGFIWWSNIFQSKGNSDISPQSFYQKIVAESAIRHSENKSLSLRTASMKGIRQHFSSLNFNPTVPDRLDSINWLLLGAKTSSLQERQTLHLRYRNQSNGLVYSLYQLPPWKTTLFLRDEKKTEYLGHAVSTWIEKGLIFIFVSPKKRPSPRN